MPLTAKDFAIEKCTCPVCGRPASVYLEEFVRKDDYIRNRHQRYQPTLF